MKFIVFKFKNAIIPFGIYLFTAFLILYSSSNLIAAKNGIILWAHSIVPSMFPFFVATELLLYTNIISIIGKLLNNIMKPIFNVPGEGAFALLMGIISGYPVGAKIVSNFKEQGICTDIECERLIAFTNNSGPLFIVGAVGISMLNSQSIGFKLLIVHLLSGLLVGFLFRWWKKNKKINTSLIFNNKHKNMQYIQTHKKKEVSFYNLGEVLSYSIQSAIKSVLIIGGFVVLFSVIVSMLTSSQILYVLANFLNPILNIFNIPDSFCNGIIIGIIEVTNGIKSCAIPNNNTSIIICSFLLGFGGLSVLFQILSITYKANISIKPYIIGKSLQAIFSAFFMWIWLYII